MVGQLCILLLFSVVEAQVVFPDEFHTAFVLRRPKPTAIKFPPPSNPDPPKALPTTPSLTQFLTHGPDPHAFSVPVTVPVPVPGRSPPPPPPPPPDHHCTTCHSVFPAKCGESKSIRIIGGQISQPGDWPWLAALGRMSGSVFVHGCGGSLISVRHVLTAEHCFISHIKPNLVRLGEYDLTRSDDVLDTQEFRIAQRYNNGYNQRTYENDIALIVLDRDVVFSDYIQPICLPFDVRDEYFTSSNLVVAGWGKTNYSDPDSFSNVPMHVEVPIQDTHTCAVNYAVVGERPGPVVDDRQLCAGDGNVDSCAGDSGGPLQSLSFSESRYYLVGIVSFGIGCSHPDYPGVYTRVSRFLQWISEKVQQF